MSLELHYATNEAYGVRRELRLLRQRWHIILVCLALQYVHGIFTQLAYRMHRPAEEPLHDVGFAAIPELPTQWRWLSEALFTSLLLSFIAWTFTPLLAPRKFACVLLWTRLLTVLVVCQGLRIISFSVTQLPGPAPHCRLGTSTAYREPAIRWWHHLAVDVGRQLGHSCGDLIFSSHMTFVLMGVLSYQHYGGHRTVKALAWTAGVVLALLIISARKHYTVDVVIAWYTVPLVYYSLNTYWNRQQQHVQGKSSATYAPCCTSDSSMHGRTCSSCGSNRCNCSCYSPQKKLRLPVKADSRADSSFIQAADVADTVDGSAVITFSPSALRLPAASLSTRSSPSSQHQSSSPLWPRLASTWAAGHRRGSSSASSNSGSDGDGWGLFAAHPEAGSGCELASPEGTHMAVDSMNQCRACEMV